MKHEASQAGSTLLWAIGALVLLSVTGAMIAKMTPSALQGKLEQEAGARAYYNANSGLNYILGMQQSAQASGTTLANFVDSMGNGTPRTMNLSDTDSFSYQLQTLNSANNTYQITHLVGTAKNQDGAAAYAYQIYGGGKGKSGAKEYTDNSGGSSSGEQTSIYSKSSIALNSGKTITGNIYTDGNVDINNNTTINGDIVSSGKIIINNGTVNGDICQHGDTTWNAGSTINGDVIIFGDLVLNGGTYNGNMYVTKKLTTNGSAKITGNIYANYIYINSISLTGDAYSETEIHGKSGSNYHQYQLIDFPDECPVKAWLVPTPATINTAGEWKTFQNETVTFSAKNNAASVTIGGDIIYGLIYNGINTNNNVTLRFDLSKGDINIFVNNSANFNSNPTIQISLDGSTWITYDKNNITNEIKEASSRIYLECHGSVSLNNGFGWVGSIFGNSVNLNKDSSVVGGVYTNNNSLSTSSGFILTYVSSNWINKYWKTN